jgi:hypothetical protein
MTGGRTVSRKLDMRLETLVQRIETTPVDGSMPSEKVHVLEQCSRATSVAELAAELNLVVGVVKILVEDLVESGHVQVFADRDDETIDDDLEMLTRISAKIRSL